MSDEAKQALPMPDGPAILRLKQLARSSVAEPTKSVYKEMGMTLFHEGVIYGGRLNDAIDFLKEVGERRGLVERAEAGCANCNPVKYAKIVGDQTKRVEVPGSHDEWINNEVDP
jgi:hypothetical protein